MSRKNKSEAKAATAKRVQGLDPKRNRKLPNIPVLVLAGLGMALAGYLTLSSWLGTAPVACGEGSSCDLVQSSRWGRFLGLPMAFWGFLTYTALAWTALRVKRAGLHWQACWLISLAGVGISLYLTLISLVVIEAACPYCLVSLGLMVALLGVSLWQRPAFGPEFSWSVWVGQSLGGAVALVLLLHLHYSGVFSPSAGPEDPFLRELSVHLSDTGAKFYGAEWCGVCTKQKDAFGASKSRLPYVECSPQGPNAPRAAICLTQNISSFPTWIINGQRYNGLQEPEELARLSNFVRKSP
ncbi:MAG: vitamin K epoxide reductase family protein [Deltaproteobacteria bacterium]|nr:vitamin K epoxide reductase family protein [Deltaproteobacteria bacterium]